MTTARARATVTAADTNLSDTQLVLLSTASERDDGVIVLHERLKGAVATSAGERLVALGLAEERLTQPGEPVWRQSNNGERWTLVITKHGLRGIGIDDLPEDRPGADLQQASPPGVTESGARPAKQLAIPTARPGSKKALVIERLRQGEGASINEIAAATWWLAHTIRAFLTGLRKTGMAIETIRQAGEPTRYRLAEPGSATAGGLVPVDPAAAAPVDAASAQAREA